MEDREIPDERIRNPDAPVVTDPTLGTPFSRVPPLKHWRGKKYAVLQLPNVGSSQWILYSFANPTQFEKLTFKKDGGFDKWTYKIFHYLMGKEKRERFLKVQNDGLEWAHYIDGGFVGMDRGEWIDVDAGKQHTKNQLVLIGDEEESQTERYKRNPSTGIVNIFPTGEENDKPIVVVPKTPYELLLEEIQKYRNEKGVESWNQANYSFSTQDSEAYGEGRDFLERINKLPEFQQCQEAIMKKAFGQIPAITDNLPTEAWTKLCKAYGIETETVWEQKQNNPMISEITYDDQDGPKFVEAFLLPELHLYPKCFFMLFNYPLDKASIWFCGPIKKDGQVLSSFTDGHRLCINVKKKSVFKIQQAFHQYFGERLVQFFSKYIPLFEPNWKSLNQPNFVYDEKLETAPEGVQGFLTFDSLLSYPDDVKNIHFALIKDPKTVLEHSDPIIAKKAQLLKNILSILLPQSFDEKWWEKVQDYKDIWELSTGTTELFKEVNLKNFNESGKKGKKKEKNNE